MVSPAFICESIEQNALKLYNPSVFYVCRNFSDWYLKRSMQVMIVQLMDRKSGQCVASGNIDAQAVGVTEIREILEEQRLHIDEFGNIRNIVGEFTKYHIQNLIPVFDRMTV